MTRIIVAFKLARNRDFTHEPESAGQLTSRQPTGSYSEMGSQEFSSSAKSGHN